MRIKNFAREDTRAAQFFRLLCVEIEKRTPLPDLNLVLLPNGIALQKLSIPSISIVEKGFHAAVIDLDAKQAELTMILLGTRDSKIRFRTTYTFLPTEVVKITFDVLQFFYERVGLYQDKLQVERALSGVFLDLPVDYRLKQTLQAAKSPAIPVVQFVRGKK